MFLNILITNADLRFEERDSISITVSSSMFATTNHCTCDWAKTFYFPWLSNFSCIPVKLGFNCNFYPGCCLKQLFAHSYIHIALHFIL